MFIAWGSQLPTRMGVPTTHQIYCMFVCVWIYLICLLCIWITLMKNNMFKNEHDLFYPFGGGPYFGGGPGQLPHSPHGKSGPAGPHCLQFERRLILDNNMTMSGAQQISGVCQNCYSQLRQIRRLGSAALSVESKFLLVHALVHSPLNFCNSVLACLSWSLMPQLHLCWVMLLAWTSV